MRSRGRPRHPDILTPREWEVLSLIQSGASNEEIGERLGITERTARYHVSEILSKLGVSSREEAVAAVGERGARPVGRPRGFGAWALALRVGLAGAAAVTLAGVAILAWGALRSTDGDDQQHQTTTFADLYADVTQGATQDGKLLHTLSEITYSGAEVENPPASEEFWIDAGADRVRSINTNPETQATNPGGADWIYSGTYGYNGDEIAGSRMDSGNICPESNSAVVGVLLRCSVGIGQDRELRMESIDDDGTWEGQPAIAVARRVLYFSPDQPGQAPYAETPSTAYLDPDTHLPIAVVSESLYQHEIQTVRFTHEFVDRSSFAANFLDPRSIGYGLRDAAVQVSDLNAQGPVYWLGPDMPEIGEHSELILQKIIKDDGFRQDQLYYQTPDQSRDLAIAYWTPDAWVTHLADLKALFLGDPACSTETNVTANGYTAQVLSMPDVLHYGFPAPDSCGARMLSTQVFNYQPRSGYFVYIETPTVVIELRAWPYSDYDTPEGVKALLEQLRPFTLG